ncbi:MAG: SpaA isopeptide-forming pilin-related protein, partial [Lachnospiraceae bacterium]|nr:SpaA isopeptide-forming pilin-related protein [Lachnospiraceae bacterium]
KAEETSTEDSSKDDLESTKRKAKNQNESKNIETYFSDGWYHNSKEEKIEIKTENQSLLLDYTQAEDLADGGFMLQIVVQKSDNSLIEGDTLTYSFESELWQADKTDKEKTFYIYKGDERKDKIGTYQIKNQKLTITFSDKVEEQEAFIAKIPLTFTPSEASWEKEEPVISLTLQQNKTGKIKLPGKKEKKVLEDTEEEASTASENDTTTTPENSAEETTATEEISTTQSGASTTEETGTDDTTSVFESIMSFFRNAAATFNLTKAKDYVSTSKKDYLINDLSSGVSSVLIEVFNKEGGYSNDSTGADRNVALKYTLSIDDDFLEAGLESAQGISGYPIAGSDEEIEKFLQETTEQQLPSVVWKYDLSQYFSDADSISGNMQQGEETLGTYIFENGTLTVTFDKKIYNRNGVSGGFSLELLLDEGVEGDDTVIVVPSNGALTLESVKEETGGDEEETKEYYSIEKEGPVNADGVKFGPYTITAEGDADHLLNGMIVEEQMSHYLEAYSVKLTLYDENNASTNYTLKKAESRTDAEEMENAEEYYWLETESNTTYLRYKIPSLNMEEEAEATNKVIKAEITLEMTLNNVGYEEYLAGRLNKYTFTDQAVLKADGEGAEEKAYQSEKINTTMNSVHTKKEGQQSSLDGTRYSWTITTNTFFPYLKKAYLADSLCSSVHNYDFDKGIVVGSTTYSTAEGNISDVTDQLLDDLKVPMNELTVEKMSQIADQASGKLVYYTYTADGLEYTVMIIPYNNYCGKTDTVKTRVKYDTTLNFGNLTKDEYVNQMLANDKTLNLTNDAVLLWENTTGTGPGERVNDIISLDKEVIPTSHLGTKTGTGYDETTHVMSWKMDINPSGVPMKNTIITDVFDKKEQNAPTAIQYRKSTVSDGTLTAGEVYTLDKKDVSGDNQETPYYTETEKGDEVIIEIHLGDLSKNDRYTLWFSSKFTDPSVLSSETTNTTIENKAQIAAEVGTGEVEVNAQISDTNTIKNELLEKTAVGSYNDKDSTMTWKVNLNKSQVDIKNAKLSDMLPQGNEFNKLISIIDNVTGETGSVSEDGSTITFSDGKTVGLDISDKANPIFSFGDISHAYTVEFEGKFTDEEVKRAALLNTASEDVTLDATIEQKKENGKVSSVDLINNVKLTGTVESTLNSEYNQQIDISDTAIHTITKNEFTKTGTYDKDSGTITWTILLNESHLDLGGFIISDQLDEQLSLSRSEADGAAIKNLRVYKIDDSEELVAGITDGEKSGIYIDNLAYQLDKQIEENSDSSVDSFTFTIPEDSGYRTAAYKIQFVTDVDTKAGLGDITNKAELRKVDKVVEESNESEGGYTAEFNYISWATSSPKPRIKVTKYSSNSNIDEGKYYYLGGAQYALEAYQVQSGKGTEENPYQLMENPVARYSKNQTTSADGIAYFMNLSKKYDGKNLIYVLKEVEAPSGYKLDETPIYIHFVGTDTVYVQSPENENEKVEAQSGMNGTSAYCEKEIDNTPENERKSAFILEKENLVYGNLASADSKEIITQKAAAGKETVFLKITPDDDKLVSKIVTCDENGQFTLERLDAGTYTIEETKAGEGYLSGGKLKLEVSYSQSGNAAPTYSYKLTDSNGDDLLTVDENKILNTSPTTSLTLSKQALYEDKPEGVTEFYTEKLSDVTFTLAGTTDAAISVAEAANNFIQTKKTDEDGTLTFTDLPIGVYEITETQKPGYEPSEYKYKVTITLEDGTPKTDVEKIMLASENDKTAMEEPYGIDNKPMEGTISFTKQGTTDLEKLKDAYHEKSLSGAAFGLYRNQEDTQPVYKVQSQENGTVTFENVEYGQYWLKEISSATGYVNSFVPVEITKAQLQTAFTYANEDAKEEGLPNGFAYTVPVKKEDANSATNSIAENALIKATAAITKKDQDGNLLSGVKFDISRYNDKATEIAADGTGMTFYEKSDVTGTSEKYEWKKYTPAYNEDQTTVKTDENGKLTISLPYGVYKLEEIVGRDGEINDTDIRLQNAETDKVILYVAIWENGKVSFQASDLPTGIVQKNFTAASGNAGTAVNNLDYGTIDLKKVSADIENGNYVETKKANDSSIVLSNAYFSIYKDEVTTPYLTVRTDANGRIPVNSDGSYQNYVKSGSSWRASGSKHLFVGSSYAVQEVQASSGHTIIEEKGSEASDQKSETFTITKNAKKWWAKLTASAMDNVSIEVVDVTNESEESFVDSGWINLRNRYPIILEKRNADEAGDKLSGAQFALYSGSTLVATMEEVETTGTYKITKSDVIRNKINGDSGSLTFTGKNSQGYDYLSETSAGVYELLPGTYILKEITAPDTYEVTSDVTLQVSEDGTCKLTQNGNKQTYSKGSNVVVSDSPIEITIHKMNQYGEELLKGNLKLELKESVSNKVVWSYDGTNKSDTEKKEPASFTIKGLFEGKTYVLSETGAAGNSYQERTKTLSFTVQKDGTVNFVNNTDWDQSFNTDHTEVVNFANVLILNHLKFVKENWKSEKLPGVTFALYQQSGDNPAVDKDMKLCEITSDSKGIVDTSAAPSEAKWTDPITGVLRKVREGLPVGKYYFVETSTVNECVINTEPVTFEIKADSYTAESGITTLDKAKEIPTTSNGSWKQLKGTSPIEVNDSDKPAVNLQFTANVELAKYYDSRLSLDGAEFKLYYKAVSSGAEQDITNDSDFVKDRSTTGNLITNSDGKLSFTILKKGIYTLKEVKAPTGYQLSDDSSKNFLCHFVVTDAAYEQTLSLEENYIGKTENGFTLSVLNGNNLLAKDDDNKVIGLNNERITGSVDLYKISSETTNGVTAINNTRFKLEQNIGTESESDWVEVEVTEGSADNTRTGLYTGKSYTFALTKEGTGSNVLEKAVYTTGTERNAANGHLTLSGLPWGTYRLTETKAAEGYLNSEIVKTFKVYRDQQAFAWIDTEDTKIEQGTGAVTNTPIDFTIEKYALNSGIKVQGAEFGIYKAYQEGDEWKKDSTTCLLPLKQNADNSLDSWNVHCKLTAGDTYVLVETKPAPGYEKAADVYFTINEITGVITLIPSSGKEHVSLENNRIKVKDTPVELNLQKWSVNTEDDSLIEDLETIFTMTGKFAASNGTVNTEAKTVTIGESGTLKLTTDPSDADSASAATMILGLIIGETYTLTENTPPIGYKTNQSIEFKVKEDGSAEFVGTIDGNVAELTDDGLTLKAKNNPLSVTLKKIASDDSRPLETTFDITGVFANAWKEGNTTKTTESITTTDGKYVFDSKTSFGGLAAGQSYILEETTTLAGYVTLSDEIRFKVENDGTLTFEKETEDGHNVTLNGNGMASIDNSNQDEISITVKNNPIQFYVNKVGLLPDGLTSGFVSGAQLQIQDENGTVIRQDTDGNVVSIGGTELTWTSDGTNLWEIKRLPEGTYKLSETVTPYGYSKANDIIFRVNSDNTVEVKGTGESWSQVNQKYTPAGSKTSYCKLEMEDTLILGQMEFTKTDNHTETPHKLSGITFDLYRMKDGTGTAVDNEDTLIAGGLVTDENGMIRTLSQIDSVLNAQTGKSLNRGLLEGYY